MKLNDDKVYLQLLHAFHEHANSPNGLFEFLQEYNDSIQKVDGKRIVMHRAKEECSMNSIESMLVKTCWKDCSPKSGHAKYKSRLIKSINVGHEKHGDSVVWGDHLRKLVEGIQELVNIMFNDVYCLKRGHWNEEPDWKQALINYKAQITCDEENPELLNNVNLKNKNNQNDVKHNHKGNKKNSNC